MGGPRKRIKGISVAKVQTNITGMIEACNGEL